MHQETAFKHAMRRLAAAVSLVTTLDGGERHGFIASSVTSVSAEPPTLLVCVNRSATSHDPLVRGGIFCVNVLHAGDAALARRFSSPREREQRFSGRVWDRLVTGAPALSEAQARFDCVMRETVAVATHSIVIGEVVAADIVGPLDPLVYVDGHFTTARPAPDPLSAFDFDRGWG